MAIQNEMSRCCSPHEYGRGVCARAQVEDSDLASFHVQPGDVIVMGSDGLLDNMADLDISREVAAMVREVSPDEPWALPLPCFGRRGWAGGC